MIETLANGYSSESTQQELPNEYQHDRVWMVFKDLNPLMLKSYSFNFVWTFDTFDNNLEMKHDFTKSLKEGCWECYI